MTVHPLGGKLPRMPAFPRPFLALALALTMALVTACGRNPEEDHLARIQALCTELARDGGGPAEAERVFGGPPQVELCAADVPPAGEGDLCPRDGTPVCIRFWAFRAEIEKLCGGPACSYGCELRAPQRAPEATCSVRFLDGIERVH